MDEFGQKRLQPLCKDFSENFCIHRAKTNRFVVTTVQGVLVIF